MILSNTLHFRNVYTEYKNDIFLNGRCFIERWNFFIPLNSVFKSYIY